MTRQREHTTVFVLRRATQVNAATLIRLIERYYAFDRIPFHRSAIRNGLKALFMDKSAGNAFLITASNKPIGYAILTYGFDLEFGGRTALMTDLYLEPEFREQGVGKRVVHTLEDFCRKGGINALELQVERTNEAALTFYRRMGFREHNRIPMSKPI